MRKIPRKNYFMYALLCVVTVLVVFYSISWYQMSREQFKKQSIMLDFLSQINEEELGSYLLENPEIVVYVSSSSDEEYRTFEKKLKNMIVKEEIKTHFVYLDSSRITDFSPIVEQYFSENLKKKKIGISVIPNVLLVSEGKVVDVLYKINDDPNVKDVTKFLEKNGVIEDD